MLYELGTHIIARGSAEVRQNNQHAEKEKIRYGRTRRSFFLFLFLFKSSGGWVKIKLKALHAIRTWQNKPAALVECGRNICINEGKVRRSDGPFGVT